MRTLNKKNFDWFEMLMNFSGTTFPLIRNDVSSIEQDYRQKNKKASLESIAHAVTREFISKSAIRAARAGGLTSIPATIPGLGTLGTVLIGATVDLAYVIKLQVELCYAISVAYHVEMEEEELKAVTLAILGFSGTTQALKGLTAGILKNSVDKIAEGYLTKGISKASAEVAERMIPRLLGRAYKLIPLLGIPLGASINAFSTMMVGKRAKRYFRTWEHPIKKSVTTECMDEKA